MLWENPVRPQHVDKHGTAQTLQVRGDEQGRSKLLAHVHPAMLLRNIGEAWASHAAQGLRIARVT